MPSIAFFCNVNLNEPYASSVRVSSLALGLAELGWECFIITSRPEFNRERKYALGKRCAVFEIPPMYFLGKTSLPLSVKLASTLHKSAVKILAWLYGVDVALAMMPGVASSLPAMLYSSITSSTYVLDFPDLDTFTSVKIFSKKSIKRAKAVLVVSNYLMYRAYQLGAKMVAKIPNGVDARIFNPEVKPALQPSERIRVVFVGRLQDLTPLLDGIKAMGELAGEYEFIIIGEGKPPRDSIFWRREAEKRRIEKHVVFLGQKPRDEIPSYIASADVCVESMPQQPYFMASNPVKILEYMAMEKPVIAPNLPGIAEIIQDEENGLLYNSPEEFTEKIKLLQDHEYRKKLGKRARKKILETFNWDTIAKKLDSTLKEII